ncbi:hypothetical protein GE107_25160, partial [Cohnella sp. CFH 77786]|uniref:CARDB domain-containing protein n=1 Tax=Cohnella sp. CFH 77786 TaxID=2662265 RepID=UPI001C610D34
TGSAAGTTGVTATWNGMTGNASLTVKALPVKITKLEVTPKEPTIFVGEIQEYVAIAYYSDSTKKDVTKDASWTISDSSIASIAKGKAKGLSAGKTGVKAEFEGLNDTAKLTVQDMPVEIKTYQDLTPQLAAPDQVSAGDKFNLKVTLANIGDEDVTDEFTANIYVRKVDDKKSGEVTIASANAEGWTLLKSHVVKSGLKAGATMNFEVPLQLLEKGTYEIKVIADEDNITADVDRSNNQDQKVTTAVKEEEPVTVPDKPRIPKTGDGSVIDPKETNNVPYMLLAVLLAVIALARKLTRNKEQ